MYHCDLTDADIAAALWRFLEGKTGSANTFAPQGVHDDSITHHPSIDLPNFNISNTTAFTPTLTTSMGTFTTQSDYSYPVSK